MRYLNYIEKQEIKCLNLTFIWDRSEISFRSPFITVTLLNDCHIQQIFLPIILRLAKKPTLDPEFLFITGQIFYGHQLQY